MMKSSPRLPQLEKACAQQRRPNAAKNKSIYFFKKPVIFEPKQQMKATKCLINIC